MTTTKEATTTSQHPAGGDFVVTVTHTVQLRVPDVAVVAEALGMPAADALGEIADVLGIAGLHLDDLDALPLDSFSIVRTDRVDIDVEPLPISAPAEPTGAVELTIADALNDLEAVKTWLRAHDLDPARTVPGVVVRGGLLTATVYVLDSDGRKQLDPNSDGALTTEVEMPVRVPLPAGLGRVIA